MASFAKRIIKRHKPKVVAITGSVGKTGTKEMIWYLLKDKFVVRKSEKNYNNEIGLPLTIIGLESGEGSVFRWLVTLIKAFWIAHFGRNYPEVLVLEMGADQKGDIKHLCQIARPDVAVVTNIKNSHLENFKTQANLVKEKTTILKMVRKNGLAILNKDDQQIAQLEKELNSKTITFAIEENAQMYASDISYLTEDWQTSKGETFSVPQGLIFKLNYSGKIVPINLPNILGQPAVYSALIAFAVGQYFKLNIIEIAGELSKVNSNKGRLKLIDGIKNTKLIDDTYNASLASTKQALFVLSQAQAKRKIAVLGDMLELGADEKSDHKRVGDLAFKSGVDILITVGVLMQLAQKEFSKKSTIGQSKNFTDSVTAGRFLQQVMQEGDVVLVKGSQGMRMEKVVVEVMNQPERKEELVVRQGEEWRG